MHPIIEVTVDGTPVAGAFYERLIDISIVDKEGIASDTFSANLNDGPPDFLALPRTGAIVDIRLGYRETGVASVGRFTVDQINGKCLPYSVSISGKAADLRGDGLKERKERHWDKKLKDIVEEVAGECGLSASVDSEIGEYQYEWFAQQDESNIAFLERLAKRHNAIFAVKQGRMIFSKRGGGTSVSGASLGSVIVTPSNIVQGTCSFEAQDGDRFQKVVAYYQDKDKAERVEVEADADSEADGVYRITEPFADVAEADKAAHSKAKDLQRGRGSASVTIVGDTSVIAGAPLLFSGVRPGLDGVPYIIDSVTHEYSKKSGFTTKISAKLYDGKSASGADKSKGGKVAPDAPAGTPTTPAEFLQPRATGIGHA
ncbi:phage late control D family protein [Mesorhizobium sp. PUT5]|uniref:phage late control D family protein n=1 Tax=Mesorhizobium sp. PUT5 TaxID=3454629 RepID=UPI003FA4868B